MIQKKYFQFFTLFFMTLFFQMFIPKLYFYNIEVVPDILIVFLTYIGIYYGRFFAIIFGFITGILQDFNSQVALIGIMAFCKSLTGYCLGSIPRYKQIWSAKMRILYIYIIYCLHFFIFYYFKLIGIDVSYTISIIIIIFHASISMVILLVIDRSFIAKGISK